MTTHGEVERSSRAAGIAAQLSSWPRRRVTLPELWRILDEADPASRTDTRRRSLLVVVLDELAESGLLNLPSSASYDRTETPHLPRFVTLPRNDVPAPPRRSIVWHPDLSWVPDLRLTSAQLRALEQVNNWLHTHRDLLVVENSDTFDSLVHALRHRGGHRIGVVGWGVGAGFEASVLSVARLEPPVSTVTYFGDLDEKGLRIPSNAAALAATAGLPPVRPAVGLYDALLTLAVPQPGQRRITPTTAAEITTWLDPRHRQRAIAHLTVGERLAQEAVGLHHLLNNDGWLRPG
jgi:Protein of unknown function C-terminus (DUF2399)